MAGTGYSRSPKLLKGALVEFSERFLGPVPNIIIFQYNPESLTRSLEAWKGGGERDLGELPPGTVPTAAPNVQPSDPPETFSLSLVLDATDALEQPGQNAVAVIAGVADRIAALELLLYPEEQSLLGGLVSTIAGTLGGALGAVGGAQPIPPRQVPVVLFVWGPGRIVPVRLSTFTVEEQTFSPTLYPMRAKVTVGMRVLTPADFPSPTRFSEKLAVKAFQYTRKQKQVLAAANVGNSIESILSLLSF